MKDFRQHFPLLNQTTYLNTAASGLLSEEVLEFRQNHDLDFLISGSQFRDKKNEIISETREAVGRLFNCAPNRVALTPNFSYGFNTLLEGVLKPKTVLLLENDYPSINWAVESRDFNTCYATIDENLEKNILEAVQKNKPDIVALSLVQYLNGIKIDFDFLKKLKKEYPKMLIFADGTQYCGTERFDFEASGIDVLGASAYKWLNAGYGNAFFLFKEAMKDKVAPKALGFNSLRGKYKPNEGNFIGKFEPGHQDTLNFGSLLTVIGLVNKIGMEEIEKEVKMIAETAKKAFTDEDLLELSVVRRKTHSSIFNIKGDDALFNLLANNNIIASQRGNGIRVGFHAFNTPEELEFLLDVLKKR